MSRKKAIFDDEASWQLKIEQRGWSTLPGKSAEESFQIFDDRLARAVSAKNPFVNEKREMQCRVLLLGGFERQKPPEFPAMQQFLDDHKLLTDASTPFHLIKQDMASIKFFILKCMDRMLHKNVFSKPSIILIVPDDAEDFSVCQRLISNQTLYPSQTVYFYNAHSMGSDCYREIESMAADKRYEALVGPDVLSQLFDIVQSGYQSALDTDLTSVMQKRTCVLI